MYDEKKVNGCVGSSLLSHGLSANKIEFPGFAFVYLIFDPKVATTLGAYQSMHRLEIDRHDFVININAVGIEGGRRALIKGSGIWRVL